MTATDDLRVEIDDAIRQRPDLLRAAESATRYLREQLDSHTGVFGGHRAVAWRYAPDPTAVEVRYSESDDYGRRQQFHQIRPDKLLDAVNRDVLMLHLLQDILRQRWGQIDVVAKANLRSLDGQD